MSATSTLLVDTNVVISALLSNGNCREILYYVFDHQLTGVTSAVLLEELSEKLIQKFHYSEQERNSVLSDIQSSFIVVKPTIKISVQKDEPDNRVLEAAVAGLCQYIVTGDKALLELEVYRSIHILTPRQFLDQMQESK